MTALSAVTSIKWNVTGTWVDFSVFTFLHKKIFKHNYTVQVSLVITYDRNKKWITFKFQTDKI